MAVGALLGVFLVLADQIDALRDISMEVEDVGAVLDDPLLSGTSVMWRCQPVADPGGCFGALDLAQQRLAPFSGQQLLARSRVRRA